MEEMREMREGMTIISQILTEIPNLRVHRRGAE